MTKTELKSIIKECMLEILSEGLGTSLNEVSEKKKAAKSLIEKKEHEKRMLQRKKEVGNAISYVTEDPILQQVLSHTAQTTLKEQSQHDVRRPMANAVSSQDFDSDEGGGDPGLDITKFFGSASKNWAAAAFPQKKNLS